MIKLDSKDRKILYELNLNSRQSFSKIGKKVGLHRNNVLYRVNNLVEKGIIKNFFTVIDSYILGYTYYRFYITFQYVNPEIKKEIINYFVKCKYTTDVHTSEGYYDLILIMAVKNISEFYNFWKKSLNLYGDYFAKQVFSIYTSETNYKYSFLLNEKNMIKHDRKKFELFNDSRRVELNDFDLHLLNIIAPNARIPTTEIAQQLDSTAVTINKRIKRLRELYIIRGFSVGLDFSKFDYHMYKANITLKERKKYRRIVKYVEANPNLTGILSSIGYVDIELIFCLKNFDYLIQIIEDLYIKFPDTIKDYSYFCVMTTPKWIYMPDE